LGVNVYWNEVALLFKKMAWPNLYKRCSQSKVCIYSDVVVTLSSFRMPNSRRNVIDDVASDWVVTSWFWLLIREWRWPICNRDRKWRHNFRDHFESLLHLGAMLKCNNYFVMRTDNDDVICTTFHAPRIGNPRSTHHDNADGINEEPAWKLTQKLALTHNSVKNIECDVTYVLKEPRRRSKCVIHKAWRFPLLCRRRRHHWVVHQHRVSD
jgi:hypothetical protein